MLPNTHHTPSCSAQLAIDIDVPLLVRDDFLFPERCIRLRPRHVQRTAVPKTAVDEHGDLFSPEDDIRATARVREQPYVKAISQAQSE